MNRRLRLVVSTALTLLFLAAAGCNSTPTVPIPPPDMRVISTTSPDTDGYANISGGSGAAEPDSIVLLYNEDIESGVMESAQNDGSFDARVEAALGDTLVLQLKVENSLSYEEYITVE